MALGGCWHTPPKGYIKDQETGLYYLQSRYYNPEIGRFINADAFTSTGQGLLGNNMFAYCRNNPVRRIDISGAADVDCYNEDGELFSNNDLISRGGGGWDAFMRSLQSAADGLNMAMGNRKSYLPELHHVLSNKNKTYTPQYKEITDRYNMSLDKGDNIIPMDGHRGRHTKAYHNFMLGSIKELDSIAQGDAGLFTTGFHLIVQFLKDNPWLPYAR